MRRARAISRAVPLAQALAEGLGRRAPPCPPAGRPRPVDTGAARICRAGRGEELVQRRLVPSLDERQGRPRAQHDEGP
eukprot:225810-Pyramimonas_sp.AAC.2